MNDKLKEILIEEYNGRFLEKKFIPGKDLVPISGKVFDEREILNMVESILDGWWTEGKYSQELELKLSSYIGVKFCSLVNSGSSANLLALSALASKKIPEDKRLKPGDEVITVAAGFPTTVNPIIQNRLVPVFVDVELGYYNPKIESIREAYSEKTKAIIIAHTLGNPYDLDEIIEFCEEKNIWLIEDNCDALGSEYKNKKTGSFGHISTLSFYPAHHITTIEGGAVLTNSALLNKIIRSLRDWGRDCWCPTGKDDTCKKRFSWQMGSLPHGYDHKYIYSHIGYNLKITDIQAAVGISQFEKLPSFIERRRYNFNILHNFFKNYQNYFILPLIGNNADPSWFGFPLLLKENLPFSRNDIVEYLEDNRIATRMLFGGNLTKQPAYDDVEYRISGSLENTELIMNNLFWVGVYPGINDEKLEYMISVFTNFFEKNKLNHE